MTPVQTTDLQMIAAYSMVGLVILSVVWILAEWNKPVKSTINRWWQSIPYLLLLLLAGFLAPLMWGVLAGYVVVMLIGDACFWRRAPVMRPFHLPDPICIVRCRIGYVNRRKKTVKGELLRLAG